MIAVAGVLAVARVLGGRVALHALLSGNLRAVALLWGRFMWEVRYAHWEPCQPLPRLPGR